MGILDELKQEANQVKNREEEEQRRQEELERRFRDELDPRMQELHTYLRDLVQQLNVVNPEIPVDFEISNSPPLKGLQQGEYFLGHYAERKFQLLFSFTRELKVVFELNDPASIAKQKEYLTNNAVKYHCKELKNDRYEVYKATFVLLGQIKGGMEFRANPSDNCIDLVMRNFTGLGRASASFSPDKIDHDFLEQLGQYLLRRSNKLLEHRIQRMSDEQRAEIRRKLEEEKREREQELQRLEEEDRQQDERKGSFIGRLLKRKG
jgi:hypothetical protein